MLLMSWVLAREAEAAAAPLFRLMGTAQQYLHEPVDPHEQLSASAPPG